MESITVLNGIYILSISVHYLPRQTASASSIAVSFPARDSRPTVIQDKEK